jgi:fumarate reductase iron-sulfur subunit
MILKVKRYHPEYEPQYMVMEYKVEDKEQTLLEALTYIKTKLDATLTFASGCRSEVCGSCSMRVNQKEVLACKYKIKDNDLVEHINLEPIRDLVVEYDKSLATLAKTKAFLSSSNKKDISEDEAKGYELQSDCILCNSCYSACPVFVTDKDFFGPFSLTKVYRYLSDSRESNRIEKIESIQQHGIWDCTLCGECAFVCPQGIQPNMDIMMLRNISSTNGFSDPKFAMQSTSFGGMDMSNMGFEPNGGFNPNGF